MQATVGVAKMPLGMILVTSDVHVRPDDPERADRFARFIESRLRLSHLREIYILGDLFDFWIGPRQPRTPAIQRVFGALEGAARQGVSVGFVPGNRDFHLDARVLEPLGIRRLGDVHHIATPAGRLCLTHGDQFCTRDAPYRITRAVIRSLPARLAWRALPPEAAMHLAGGFRSVSLRSVRRKSTATMALSNRELAKALRAGADVIICGHVHEQAHRKIEYQGAKGDLFTLAGWEEGEPHLIVERDRIFFGNGIHHDD
ncbi:MAG: UDP-2,3-diacylglucosamine diphosphatase [Planctomycetota bacterium]|nr:UDP-2,3-diacylglucosamine diphosphatase [Planctomycetota bacterium]